MTDLIQLQQIIFNTAHLIEPGKAEAILHVLSERLGITSMGEGSTLHNMALPQQLTTQSRAGGYGLIGSTAVIDVSGTLVHRGSWMGARSGMTSYEGVAKQIDSANSDDEVSKILFRINSFGGTSSGCFDLADKIHANSKPIDAFICDNACSAAYLMASACNKIYATQTARAGSIGVIMVHRDQTKSNKKRGVKVTHIYSGQYKALGSPDKELTNDEKQILQESTDEVYEMFTSRVAEWRGMQSKDVIGTNALVYLGSRAVSMGLVDEITSQDQLFSSLSKAGNSTLNVETQSMSDPKGSETPAIETPAGMTATGVISLCEKAGWGEMATRYIKANADEAAIEAGLAEASETHTVLVAAGIETEQARAMIASAQNPTDLVRQVISTMQSEQTDISTQQAAELETKPKIDTTAIYSRMNGGAYV